MLDNQTRNELQNWLTSLMVQMRAGEGIDCIEYGDPKGEVGGFMSFFRVYYMNTAGGPQFCYKEISNHLEGSGIYNPDLQATVDYIMDRVIFYHRPLPDSIRERLEKMHGKDRSLLTFIPLQKVMMKTSEARGRGLAAYNLQHFDKTIPTVVLK